MFEMSVPRQTLGQPWFRRAVISSLSVHQLTTISAGQKQPLSDLVHVNDLCLSETIEKQAR